MTPLDDALNAGNAGVADVVSNEWRTCGLLKCNIFASCKCPTFDLTCIII